MTFVRSTGNVKSAERRARLALKEQKRRVRAHEAEQQRLVDADPNYVPEVKKLRPRSRQRREWLRVWIATSGFRYVKLPEDVEDYEPRDRPAMARRIRRASNRRANGWDFMTQARSPFCATQLWPWPSLPPHLVEDAINSYAASKAREVLEDDLDVQIESRLTIPEFLEMAGLDASFYVASRDAWMPELPIDWATFVAGMAAAQPWASG